MHRGDSTDQKAQCYNKSFEPLPKAQQLEGQQTLYKAKFQRPEDTGIKHYFMEKTGKLDTRKWEIKKRLTRPLEAEPEEGLPVGVEASRREEGCSCDSFPFSISLDVTESRCSFV